MTDPTGTVELGRGFFDTVEYGNGRLMVSGWEFLPEHPFDGFVLKVNGVRTGEARLRERADVFAVFPAFPAALPSGFSAEAAIPEAEVGQWIDIDMVGMQGDREIARLTTIFKLRYRGSLPEPPPHLMRRVAAHSISPLYWSTALTSYGEFSKGIARHADLNTIDRLLDWGCGCGRVVSLFLEHSPIPEIHGCDIDPEGVAWCQANLEKGCFRVVNPQPPTDYPDNMFSVVIGYSVFTHLVRDMQKAWLGEMQRIIKPGGLLLASCHGDFATLFAPPAVQEEVRKTGISDISPDPSLDGIAPAGYYRGVFQSREYTLREWGRFFDVVEYVPKGMGHCHDLVIMRKRSAGAATGEGPVRYSPASPSSPQTPAQKSAEGNVQMSTRTDPDPVELGRGFFDNTEYLNGRLVVSGWQFLPGHPFDGFVLKVNGVRTEGALLRERPDVHSVFSAFPAALPSGFSAEVAIPETEMRQWVDIDMVGMQGDREIARLTTVFKLGYRGSLPEPPPHLMKRVAGNSSSRLFWSTALTSYGEFSKGIARHSEPGAIDRLLDWGCGCGRVVSLFLEHSGVPEIHGCDIDPEGAAWCQANLKAGHFRAVKPHPPTDYSDNMFAAVIGYSVFTHLVRDMQSAWLGEMRRIIKPGGLFLASCHGDFSTLFAPPTVQEEVRETGISDISPDASLDGIAPAGYYRGVFQSREYTLKEWGRFFEVVEYIPRGMGHFQDLVIMRKRS